MNSPLKEPLASLRTFESLVKRSIKQGQLYGENDEGTQEWTDGILALTVRYASSAEQNKRQWILLDGPVDAAACFRSTSFEAFN